MTPAMAKTNSARNILPGFIFTVSFVRGKFASDGCAGKTKKPRRERPGLKFVNGGQRMKYSKNPCFFAL